MGLSLPLLARALTVTLGATGRITGSLYGWNTLGAAAGAFASTWILLPKWGLEPTLWLGAALNVACAAAAAWLVSTQRTAVVDRAAASTVERTVAAEDDETRHEASLPFHWWALLYALSGFVALALEIAWFRVLGVMLKSTAFTFGTLLALYLSGIGLGAAIGARLVGRSRRPGSTFLVTQFALILYAACALIVMIAMLGAGYPAGLVRYLGGNEALDLQKGLAVLRTLSLSDAAARAAFFEVLRLYVMVPALLIGPATLAMGFGFPFLQKAAHTDLSRYGRRVGTLLAANIAGSTLGAMAADGCSCRPLARRARSKCWRHSPRCLPFRWQALGRQGRARLPLAVGAAAIAVTAVVVARIPDNRLLWSRLHSASPRQVLLAEDGSGLSVLKSQSETFGGTVTVFVNGLSQSWIPYGNIHTTLGALPAFVHPDPRDVAIIGLGSGDTAFAAAGRPEVARLVCIELIAAQIGTLARLSQLQRTRGSCPCCPIRVSNIAWATAAPTCSTATGDSTSSKRMRCGPRLPTGQSLLARGLLRPAAPPAEAGRHCRDMGPNRPHPAAPSCRVIPVVLGFRDIYIGSERPIAFDPGTVAARAAGSAQRALPEGRRRHRKARPRLPRAGRRPGSAAISIAPR